MAASSVLPGNPRRARVCAARAALIAMALAGTLVSRTAPALDLGNLTRGLLENVESVGKVIGNADVLLGQYSEAQEDRLGHAASAVLLGAASLHANEEVQRYVNRVGAWLARHTERPDLAWRFGVLDSASVNAFAAPGGYVFVTRGLLGILRNESELAGVLAHEIAHVLAQHHLRAMTAQERFKLAADLALDASGKGSLISDALVSVTREVYAKGLSRGDEFEADRMGVVIAARAGYDPHGLSHVLRTIQGAASDTEVTGFFLGTHPSADDRMQQLRGVLDAGFALPAPPRGAAFEAMRARL